MTNITIKNESTSSTSIVAVQMVYTASGVPLGLAKELKKGEEITVELSNQHNFIIKEIFV